MGSKRRAAAAQLLRFFRPPFLPPLRLAFFPALEIAAARDFGMGRDAGDRRERGAQNSSPLADVESWFPSRGKPHSIATPEVHHDESHPRCFTRSAFRG
jgi:hypothetical protein